jgi:hypothetical protein
MGRKTIREVMQLFTYKNAFHLYPLNLVVYSTLYISTNLCRMVTPVTFANVSLIPQASVFHEKLLMLYKIFSLSTN